MAKLRVSSFDTRRPLELPAGPQRWFHSLPQLEKFGVGKVSRLPVSLRVLLESVLRNVDGRRIRDTDVEALARWEPGARRDAEVPFVVGRVLLQDFTGVPLLVDLAAMRAAVQRRGRDISRVQPLVPVDLVIDHSVQVDRHGAADALQFNMDQEFRRNRERYQFLKWGAQAFDGLRIVPPGFGICHQVNLEYLAPGVLERGDTLYPDSLVGTDSHTPMINGLGIVGWGVGGIEAEAAMLGQPVYLLLPDVVGVHLHGRLPAGATATDLVLRITQLLREAHVVGKFVEFHGEGAASLPVPDRATIGNMSPEYGATIGYFPVDEESCRYLLATGRSPAQVETVRRYYQAQGMFGIPRAGECDYSTLIDLDLATVEPAVAGPKRPQDRIVLGDLKEQFLSLLTGAAGYGKPQSEVGEFFEVLREAGAPRPGGGRQTGGIADPRPRNTNMRTELEMMDNRPTPNRVPESARDARGRGEGAVAAQLTHGDVVIAAITSCTNTSNPAVMLAAGLLAKKAVELGLTVPPWVKTSLAPGSRVVSEYLAQTGLQAYLDRLGFNVVGFGCTTCIGNSGPLDRDIEATIARHDIVAASVLSGNRNFEARIHQSVKANFLMSPPLVVALAIAGRVDIDLTREPLAQAGGRDIFLRDLWPTLAEIDALRGQASDPAVYRRIYDDFAGRNPLWNEIPSGSGQLYGWDPASTYIQEPPYFDASMAAYPAGTVKGARALAIFGDSITTDHISPAGAIKPSSPAGEYLQGRGVAVEDLNSYGARRGSHDVMVRGTFANIRIRNQMVPGTEGGVTRHQPGGEVLGIHEAAERYRAAGVPLLVIAGSDYGAGSSRDWAAKGARLLGVRAVIARSFERIHRSNLIGMGVLPCQLPEGTTAQSLGLDGSEVFELELANALQPRMAATLHIGREGGQRASVPLVVRIDTPIEVAYYEAGGILPYVLEQLIGDTAG